jgi:hypothetical protein
VIAALARDLRAAITAGDVIKVAPPAPAPPPAVPAQPAAAASPPQRPVPVPAYPATVSTPPPGQPWAYPGPWQPVPAAGPRGGDGPAVAGLLLTVASSAAYIAYTALSPGAAPGKSLAFGYASGIIPLIVAVAALAGGRFRRSLLPFLLGTSLLSLAGALDDFAAIPAWHPLQAGGRVTASFEAGLLGDVIGIAAVVLLLAALRRFADRGPWAAPRVIGVLLLATMAAGWACGTLVWARKLYVAGGANYSDWGLGKFASADSPVLVYIGAGLAVAVLTALYALGLRSRSLGGIMAGGWIVAAFLIFGQFITAGWQYTGTEAAANWVAGLLLLASAALAIFYAARKP